MERKQQYEGKEEELLHLTKEEKHLQCLKEIKGTLIVVACCCLWHVLTAFLLNGSEIYFLGMPAWYSVSTLGTILIALGGIRYLLKNVFRDFSYDEEVEDVQ